MSGSSTSKSTTNDSGSAPATHKSNYKIAPQQQSLLNVSYLSQTNTNSALNEDEMERHRKYSASEPLLPEAIHLIQVSFTFIPHNHLI
jgi:hypothetical protein